MSSSSRTSCSERTRTLKGYTSDRVFDALEELERRADGRGVSMACLALAWALSMPELTAVVVGPGRAEHLAPAFEALELAVSRGWIGAYGLATWDGFLLPDSDRSHLSIVDLFDVALEVGQADHHLRALQLPYGLARGDGAVLASQLGPDGKSRAILESLRDTGTAVFASAPLYGGRLVGHVPAFVRDAFPEAQSDATAALQFTRSTAAVTCAVVGMRDAAHVAENMGLAQVSRAKPEIPAALFEAREKT